MRGWRFSRSERNRAQRFGVRGGRSSEATTLNTFEEAVAEHRNMVYSFAYYYLGNAQEAEDVTQDVLLRLWRNWSSLESEVVPRWLNRVTRNRSYDLLRSRTRARRVVSEDGDEEVIHFAESLERGPEGDVERASVREQVRRAVLQLPEPYRSAVVLREILELTYLQVSDALELPVNTVKTHVHRGRRMLRNQLREAHHVEA